MMKYLLLLLLCPNAFAQSNVQNVHEVATSTGSITQTINVCATSKAIDVAATTSSGTLAGAFAIEVYNLASSTNSVICGPNIAVSTDPFNAFYGREVPAGVGVYWGITSARKLYCWTANLLGCTRATITQLK